MARVLRKLQDDPQMAKECTDFEAIARDVVRGGSKIGVDGNQGYKRSVSNLHMYHTLLDALDSSYCRKYTIPRYVTIVKLDAST